MAGISKDTFAFGGQAVSSLFEGFSKSTSAKVIRAQAEGQALEGKNYAAAADFSREQAQFARQSHDISDYQMSREVFKGIGSVEADIAGSGFTDSGTGGDLLRESAAQGALLRATGAAQDEMTADTYEEQGRSYDSMAAAAAKASEATYASAKDVKKSATGDWIQAGIGAAAAILPFLSDARLKRDIVRVGEMPSGLPIYRFKYLDDDTEHLGVMAQEAREKFPDAVFDRGDGYFMVDYARIG